MAFLTVLASSVTLFADIDVKSLTILLFPILFDLNLTENIHFCWKKLHTQ